MAAAGWAVDAASSAPLAEQACTAALPLRWSLLSPWLHAMHQRAASWWLAQRRRHSCRCWLGCGCRQQRAARGAGVHRRTASPWSRCRRGRMRCAGVQLGRGGRIEAPPLFAAAGWAVAAASSVSLAESPRIVALALSLRWSRCRRGRMRCAGAQLRRGGRIESPPLVPLLAGLSKPPAAWSARRTEPGADGGGSSLRRPKAAAGAARNTHTPTTSTPTKTKTFPDAAGVPVCSRRTRFVAAALHWSQGRLRRPSAARPMQRHGVAGAETVALSAHRSAVWSSARLARERAVCAWTRGSVGGRPQPTSSARCTWTRRGPRLGGMDASSVCIRSQGCWPERRILTRQWRRARAANLHG